MTEQEAIKRLLARKPHIILHNEPTIVKYQDACDMAIQALEKQIVKPPKFENLKGGFVQKRCVVCGNKILPFYASYCTSCGQRLE